MPADFIAAWELPSRAAGWSLDFTVLPPDAVAAVAYSYRPELVVCAAVGRPKSQPSRTPSFVADVDSPTHFRRRGCVHRVCVRTGRARGA